MMYLRINIVFMILRNVLVERHRLARVASKGVPEKSISQIPIACLSEIRIGIPPDKCLMERKNRAISLMHRS
ncbi:MAG TPA: hypothetical protein VMW89_14615 [Desulfatiglandales bacterium]|nr:hypothetical protein [Desulfatiglandales bacterium]